MIYKVKSSAGIITILIGFAILLIVSVYYVFYRRNLLSIINRYPEQSYIAHGGGAIDGYLYTNSLEVLSAQLPSLSGRVLIECFSIERYQDALAYGWGMPMSSYVDLSPESINVVNVKGKRYTWAGIFPMTFALYGKERCTRRDADSIFALDPRVRFVYVDIVE